MFESINGAGKTTIINKLNLANTKIFKFPNRNTTSGLIINKYLKQEIILTKEENLQLFAQNRLESYNEMKQLLDSGTNIICDRYLYSAIAYHTYKEYNELITNTNPLDQYNTSYSLYNLYDTIHKYDTKYIVPDIIFLINGDYLYLRDEAIEKYHTIDPKLLFNNYKSIFNIYDLDYLVVDNKYKNIDYAVNKIKSKIDDLQFNELL